MDNRETSVKPEDESIVLENRRNIEAGQDPVPTIKRGQRRQSTIFTIVDPEAKKHSKKLCLPIACQKCLLITTVTISLLLTWLSLVPFMGYEIYLGVTNSARSNVTVNLTLSERLVKVIDLSNTSVECPQMYIFVPEANSCKPKCGEWSGCGPEMYHLERYLLIILDCVGLAFGVIGIVSWVVSYKEWKLKHFAIFTCIIVGGLSCLLFAALDLPGPKYIFCSNEDKEWDAVGRELPLHIQVYSGVLYFMSSAFLIWLWFALINIALVTFFPLSERIQSNSFNRKLLAVQSVLGWGIPVCLLGIFFGMGGRFNLERPIQHPSRHTTAGRFVLGIPFFFIYRLIITTFFIVLYRIRSQVMNSQKYSTMQIQLSGLEKRFITIGVIYTFVIILRSFYGAFLGFSIDWEKENREYAACITLNSPFISFGGHDIGTQVVDLLPVELRDQVPSCRYPCVVPVKTIFFRCTWMIIFSVINLHPIIYVWSRLFVRKSGSNKTIYKQTPNNTLPRKKSASMDMILNKPSNK